LALGDLSSALSKYWGGAQGDFGVKEEL